jgi:hypothetical protein
MKFNRNLVTGLIGLALLAAPISAAAMDNDSGRSDAHQAQAQSQSHNNAPARTESRDNHSARVETRAAAPAARNEVREQHSARVETRNEAPAVATRNDTRENRTFHSPPVPAEHRDVREDRHDNRVWNNNDGRDYRTYGNRDYDHDDYDHDRDYAAGGWIMPRGYGGGACAWAQHLRNVYRHDEETGHPAAAADVLYQLHRAERSCGVPYGYNSYRYGF